MAGKITDYPPMTLLKSGDLIDVSDLGEGATYTSKSLDYDDLVTGLEGDITFRNIYSNDGTIGTGRTATLTDTLTFISGKVLIAASDTGYASLNMPSGVDTTLPTDGDFWWNGTNLYFRNGLTSIDLLGGGADGNGIYDGSGSLSADTTVTNAGFDLSITGTGNFGIGTSTPTEKLEVVGNVKISENVGIASSPLSDSRLYIEQDSVLSPPYNNAITLKRTDGSKTYAIGTGTAGVNFDNLRFQQDAVDVFGININGNFETFKPTNVGGDLQLTWGANLGLVSLFNASYEQSIRFHDNGRQIKFDNKASAGNPDFIFDWSGSVQGDVGIGTSTPTDKLQVVGTVNANRYKVNGVAGANFGPGAVTSITVVDGLVTAIS